MCLGHFDFFRGCEHRFLNRSKSNLGCNPPCDPLLEIDDEHAMLCSDCVAALMRSLERVERAQSQEGWRWTLKAVEFSPSPSPEERLQSTCA
jgi:hypothetical protein